MTLLLGAALSIGGATEALNDVHFVVRRDLDRVQVVKEKGSERQVLARIDDTFAANSIYKIARALPDAMVSSQSSLFETSWLSRPGTVDDPDPITDNMRFISQAMQEQFFRKQFPYGGLIHEHSAHYDVDPSLVAAVIETESRFRKRARSQVGAQGLMQLMPRTGRWMGAKNLYDPDQNVEAGVRYFKYLQDRFDGNLKKTIAAYNAGEGTVRKYGGVPPYRETRDYVKNVMKRYEKNSREFERYKESSVEPASTFEALGASE